MPIARDVIHRLLATAVGSRQARVRRISAEEAEPLPGNGHVAAAIRVRGGVSFVGVDGEDAKRLERLSQVRRKKAADVIAELLRDAENSLG